MLKATPTETDADQPTTRTPSLSSPVLTQVRLSQAHRIRGRIAIAQSYLAAAELAQAMTPSSDVGNAEGSIPSPTTSFAAYLPVITSALDRLTTSANALPGSRSDINFHRTMDRKFANDLDEASERVLRMAEQLLAIVEVGQEEFKGKAKGKGKDAKPAARTAAKTRRKLEDEDDVVEGYKRGVLGVVDGLLEDAVSATCKACFALRLTVFVRTRASMI